MAYGVVKTQNNKIRKIYSFAQGLFREDRGSNQVELYFS